MREDVWSDQLGHDLVSKQPHGLAYPGRGNSAAAVELQNALSHGGELFLEVLEARDTRRWFIVDTDLPGSGKVPGHPAHSAGGKIGPRGSDAETLQVGETGCGIAVAPVFLGDGVGFLARLGDEKGHHDVVLQLSL